MTANRDLHRQRARWQDDKLVLGDKLTIYRDEKRWMQTVALQSAVYKRAPKGTPARLFRCLQPADSMFTRIRTFAALREQRGYSSGSDRHYQRRCRCSI